MREGVFSLELTILSLHSGIVTRVKLSFRGVPFVSIRDQLALHQGFENPSFRWLVSTRSLFPLRKDFEIQLRKDFKDQLDKNSILSTLSTNNDLD